MGNTIYNDPVDSAKSWESLDEAVNADQTNAEVEAPQTEVEVSNTTETTNETNS